MTIKFSVLLPTRERLDLLKYAITSVMQQDYENWEIIVSDNDSQTCDVRSYITSLKEPRIKYSRTDQLLPVTENWNRALYLSSGDYVIMLGDDDCLLKHYFSDLSKLIAEYRNPDFIYTSAYIYGYPGVMPGYPDGYLQADKNSLHENPKEYLLDLANARSLARKAMSFHMDYAFNMQYSLVSRAFIDRLKSKGTFYQSPYPDFYATNAMFLTAEKILVVPKPMVVIGISPKSYGFYHFNQKESEGVKFLFNEEESQEKQDLSKIILAGSKNNTSWLLAMECIKNNFRYEIDDLQVNYRRYRLFQVLFAFKNHLLTRQLDKEQFGLIYSNLTLWEKIFWGIPFNIAFRLLRLFSEDKKEQLLKRLRTLFGKYEFEGGILTQKKYLNILDVFNSF